MVSCEVEMGEFFDILGVDLPRVPGGGFALGFVSNLPPTNFWVIVILSLIGAALLSRHTSSSGAFNLPLNFITLFLGATCATWLASDLDLKIEANVQLPALFSTIGMTLTGLCILWLAKKE
jgi:hypothetical protein